MKRLLPLLLFVNLACITFPRSAQAAAVSVTTTTDEVNGNTTSIANLIATPGGAGISLREAIIAANNTAGADTITVPAGTYNLTIAGSDNTAAGGDLDINDSVTINGNTAATTIIQMVHPPGSAGDYKVIGINQDGSHLGLTVSINRVTITGGKNDFVATGSFQETGGGMDIFLTGTGNNISLTDCVISNNTVTNNVQSYGGGVNIDSSSPGQFAGTVTFTRCTISNNKADATGGGLNLFADKHNVVFVDCVLTGNECLARGGLGAQGGGVNIRHTNGGTNTFTNTIISNNVARGFGGGICISGAGNQLVTMTGGATVDNDVLANGVSSPQGGGIYNTTPQSTSLTNVIISGNTCSGGTGTPQGGGVFASGGTMLLERCLIAGNSTTGNSGGAGSEGTLTLINTTISGNTANGSGGGFGSQNTGTNTLINVTIANNRADNDNNGSGIGGGVSRTLGNVNLKNTIVAGNFNENGVTDTADDIAGSVNADFSLIGTNTGTTISGANNVTNVDARLGPLQNNGGSTQTHALLGGSPALDNGSNALVPGGVTTDQRGTGFARIKDAGDADTTDEVDIGAYEAHPAVEDITDKTTNEDTPFSFTFNFGDVDLPISTITATSGNTVLIPNGNLVQSGSGASRNLSVTPVANQFGSSTITVTVSGTENSLAFSSTDTFVVPVNPIADTPSATGATTSEDTQTSSGLVLSRNAVDGAEVTHFKITGITGGTLSKNNGTTVITNTQFITFAEGNAGLKFTPAANLNNPSGDTFGFTVQAAVDSLGTGISPSTSTTITVTEVNDAPTGTNDSLSTIAEDSGARTNSVASLLANDSQGPANESGQTLTMINVGSAVGGTVSMVGTNVVFTPAADFNGAASFVYTLQDNGTTAGVNDFKTGTATVSFTISEVNDAPGGVNDILSDVLANSGTRTNPFTTFLANDSKGPANEGSQVLTILSVGSAVGGAVTISGTNVLFTPASNYFGPASFVYTLQDNGTTSGANDFKTSTATASFNIIAVPPTITCPPNITTNTAPGGCLQRVAFSATIVTGVPPPTLTYTLDTNVITSPYVFSRGTNIVMVTASNGAPPNATCSFSVIVRDTEPPTPTCPANITVTNVAGNCPAVVNFSVSGSDNCGSPTVLANPPSGSTFAVGTNSVTLLATDAAGNTNTCSFKVTVLPGPSPLLSIWQSDTNVVLCWSNVFACYALQYTPALVPAPATNGWTFYPGPYATNNGNIYVTNGIDATNRFFRLIASGASAACTIAPSGLVSWWRAESNATDSVSGNNGTLQNGATFAAGEVGTAFSFDGLDDAVTVGNVAGLANGNTPHTIEAWVKVSAYPAVRSWPLLLGNEGVGAHHWLLNPDGSTQIGVFAGAQVTPTLPVGVWVHLAAAFDGATLRVYTNGVSAGSVAASFNLQGKPLTLAQSHQGQNFFAGLIDELSIYNRALSDSEITAIYNAGSSGKCTGGP